jgi:hypothetical protein
MRVLFSLVREKERRVVSIPTVLVGLVLLIGMTLAPMLAFADTFIGTGEDDTITGIEEDEEEE